MAGLREARHRLHPAEDFLDPFAVNLAGLVGLARRHFLADVRAPTRGVAGRIRLSAEGLAGPDELRRVVSLVRSNPDAERKVPQPHRAFCQFHVWKQVVGAADWMARDHGFERGLEPSVTTVQVPIIG